MLLVDVVSDEEVYYAFGELPRRHVSPEQVFTQPAEQVAETDRVVDDTKMGKGTTASTLAEARACIIAAARTISIQYQPRTEMLNLASDGPES